MANYPDTIYEPRVRANRSGVVYDAEKETVWFKEDADNIENEILAIETELGILPKGAYDSVKDFLADLLLKVISVFTDIPDVPDSYEDQAGKVLLVKGTEDGLEFGEAPPPGIHHESHENGGDDEISAAGLSGELADPQSPKAHKTSHAAGGSDVLSEADIGVISVITFIIDGGGSAITTGEKGHLRIPFKCEIQRVTLLADQEGDIKIDIWKDTYANFPPTDADSICAGYEPAISAAQKSEDTDLIDWTKEIAAGDILAFNVNSAATITRVTLALKVKKT